MKKITPILFLAAICSLHGQTISMPDLQGKVFDYGSNRYVTAKGTFNFECDCCSGKLLFNADSTFYAIDLCLNVETLISGKFALKNNELILYSSNTEVSKRYNEEKEFDESQPAYIYTDTIISPEIQVFKAAYKNRQWQFSDSDMHILPSPDSYENLLRGITDDNRTLRLKTATDNNLNIFENTDFSAKYDSIIIKRGLEKLNAKLLLNYFDEENKIGDLLRSNFNQGKAYYSPDGLFKIFVFTGEDCGAHCSNIFVSYIQFASGAVSTDIYSGNITTLEKYDNDTYIIIDSGWSGGTTGGKTLSVRLFSFENESAVYHPLFFNFPDNAALRRFYDTQENGFSIFSPWWGGDFGKMEYDTIKRKVKYSYVDPASDREWLAEFVPAEKLDFGPNEGLLITGEFSIENGYLANFKEEYTIVKIPNNE